MRPMVAGWVMNPTTRMLPAQRGQTSGSISYTRRSKSAQRLRRVVVAGGGAACAWALSFLASPVWSRCRLPLAAFE